MRRGPFLAFCFMSLTLSACATFSSFGSAFSDYRRYVEGRVKTERLFDHGRQLFSAKVLVADAALHAEQEKVTPGYSFRFDPAKDQVVLAVTSFGRRSPTAFDFQPRLNGQPPDRIEEITSTSVVERLYPYAHPFYRVFLVDFARRPGVSNSMPNPAGSSNFEILSPWGRLTMLLEFGR